MSPTPSPHPGGPQDAPEDRLDIASVVAPAPGGPLAAYVEYLKEKGRPALLSPDGREAWVPGVWGETTRFPTGSTGQPNPNLIRRLLRLKGIWMASYMLPDSPQHPANCFNYLCTDSDYDVERLTKNGRRDVRRGMRCFQVRRCTWDELKDKGFPPYADTEARHGRRRPPREELEDIVAMDRDCPFVEIWGAWSKESLAAWIKAIKFDDWAMITTACSADPFLRDCPNNALAYLATRTFLVEERRRSVSFGISSLQATENILSLHKFKLRMGYQSIPMCRTFVVHPLLRPLLHWRVSSMAWDGLARLYPGSGTVQKLAGLSRLLSGRVGPALAWAEEDRRSAEGSCAEETPQQQ